MITKILRINEIAKEKPKEVFTSVYHLINQELLMNCYKNLDRYKATGLDNVTKDMYEENLETNIENLVSRLKNKSYKPSPARVVSIPKANGKLRKLAIANFEDKIVQLAVKRIIEAIFEPKFLDTMFGYRPRRGCHEAIEKLRGSIITKKICYVVEADIKGYFDNIDHKLLIKAVRMHIRDTNLIRLIEKFLKAGVIENKEYYRNEKGTPQGSIISPILANIYMHYTLTLWFEKKIRPTLKGEACIVNYADDFVCCFQYGNEAERFYKHLLPRRLKEVNLELAEDKTRKIEFGRFAERNIKAKTGRKPETFDFLGFTFYCSKSRNGKFRVKVKTSSKKFRIGLKNFNQWLKQNRILALQIIIKKLREKLIGYYNYYGITDNMRMLKKFYNEIMKILYKWLNKRSQRKSYTWEQFNQMIKSMNLPTPKIKVKYYAM